MHNTEIRVLLIEDDPAVRVGSAQAWMKMHIWLSLLAVPFVGPKGAFAILAMAILAECIVAVPQRFSGSRIGRLCKGGELRKRKQQKCRDKSLHGKSPES